MYFSPNLYSLLYLYPFKPHGLSIGWCFKPWCSWPVCVRELSCAACITPAFRRGKGLWQRSPSTGLCRHCCHGSVWLTVWCAGNHVCFSISPDWWAREKEFFVFLFDCKGWRMLKKKGMLCVGRLEKNNPFFYSSFDFANGGKGRILAVEHILGPVKCSWRIWVAHCSCAVQLHGPISLILSYWKLNQASPCPFACSLRKLWVRQSHEPSVCTLTSPGLHQFTSNYSPSWVLLHSLNRVLLTESSLAAGTTGVRGLSAVLAEPQPVPLVYFLNELMVLVLQVFYGYWLRTWVLYSSINLTFFSGFILFTRLRNGELLQQHFWSLLLAAIHISVPFWKYYLIHNNFRLQTLLPRLQGNCYFLDNRKQCCFIVWLCILISLPLLK